MKQILVSALVFALSGSPAFAQSLAPAASQSLRESARAEAIKFAANQSGQNDEYMPGGMKPGYFWTSIGLMSAGGAVAAGAAIGNAYCASLDCGGEYEGMATNVALFGAGLAGAGVVVWLIGKHKARAAGNPQIVLPPKGIGFRSQISF